MNGVTEFFVGWLLLSAVLTATICRAIHKARVAKPNLRSTGPKSKSN